MLVYLAMTAPDDAIAIARATVDVLEGRRPAAALATVTARAGSAPQVLGARMLFWRDDAGREQTLGTVGGGAIEALVQESCRRCLQTGRPDTVAANLVRDLGMCCGGTMEVLVEYLQASPRLFVVGAGHVARALAPVAGGAGFRVTVLDDREALFDQPAYDQVRTVAFDADELDAAIPDPSPGDFFVIVTRDHRRDEQALAALLERPHAYLGMIGSRRKVHRVAARVLRRYVERGRALPDLSRVRTPVGLALGGRTPGEIAVSIAAELVAVRCGGTGAPMNAMDEVVERITRDVETG